MDSNQKVLKELSDLTRNLDVLSREIREMNKLSSQNQKTAIKTIETMENSVKKTEKMSSRIEKSTDQKNSIGEKVETTSNPAKSPTGIFSNFINSIKDTFKKEPTNVPKKSTLAALNQPPTALKDISSLNPSDPEYSKIINQINIGGDPRGIVTASIKQELETLKNKEKRTKEEEEQIKKMESYVKEKEGKETSNTSQPIPSKPEITVKKDENKGFFEKLMEKMSPGKGEKEVLPTIGTTSKPETKTESNKVKESKKDENKGFFTRLAEKIRPEKKEDKEAPKTSENKPEEKKSSAEEITQTPKLTEGQKIKQDFKNLYNQSKLGKSISEIKSLLPRENKPKSESGKTEMKKETQTLKSPSVKDSNPSITQEKEKKDDKPIIPAPVEIPSTSSDQNTTPPISSIETKKNSESDGLSLTPEDIKEIKSLLGSISTSLKGPLTFKDNKPFRPKSNMLE